MRSRIETARRGFTLIEGLVTLLLISIIIVGLLTLLDSSSRLAKQETQAADAQGGGRSAIYEVTRLLRQARVGHLSPLSAVMPLVNNANGTTDVIKAGSVDHVIRKGTDAIEVRGTLFGDTYHLTTGDVACTTGQPCNATSTGQITIRQVTTLGYQNFAAGGRPEIANRTQPFYFVVSSTSYQTVTGTDSSGSAPQSIPTYLVGRVDANSAGTWYTLNAAATPATFQFNITFVDASAQELNATADPTIQLATPFAGGAVDVLLLFVDRGPQDPADQGGGYTHPFLAQAVGRPDGTGKIAWDVQRIIDDVEDIQFAFGIDGLDGSVPDRGVDPSVVSTTSGADEWAFNVTGETLASQASPKRYERFLVGPNGLLTTEAGAMATEALRAIQVSIVTKSLDPDFKFDGPGATGIKTLDSTADPVSATQRYRRRLQTMAVNLRNFI